MPTTANETWLCCLCGLEKHPFGALACDSTCDHRKTPHLTGRWYLQGVEQAAAESIGIAAISDEADVKLNTTHHESEGN